MIDDLIERVRGLTGPDRESDRLIAAQFGYPDTEWSALPHAFAPAFTASLDAAVALVEVVLPGHTAGWQPGIRRRAWAYIYYVSDIEVHEIERGVAATPPIAIILALLIALKAKEARDA